MDVQKREIFVGMVSECPCIERVGKFAYHIKPLPGEQQTDLDFSYSLESNKALADKLMNLHTRYQGAEIVLINDLPRIISDGWAPDYRFSPLGANDFEEIKKLSGLESKFPDG